MPGRWQASIAMIAAFSFGGFGAQSAAHASNIVDCSFTVTAAGNGQQILSPNLSAPVGTVVTGQVVDLFNITATQNGNVYWTDHAFSEVGDYYPVRSIAGVIYMAKDPNSCFND